TSSVRRSLWLGRSVGDSLNGRLGDTGGPPLVASLLLSEPLAHNRMYGLRPDVRCRVLSEAGSAKKSRSASAHLFVGDNILFSDNLCVAVHPERHIADACAIIS